MVRIKELSSEPHQSIIALINEGLSMPEMRDRKRSRRPQCSTVQVDKNIRISSFPELVFLVRNSCLTGPQLAALLNSSHKTPVSWLAVERLWNAGLPGRVSKKMPYLRLAGDREILK